VLRTIAEHDLVSHAAAMGAELAAGIERLAHPLVGGVRGAGLLLAIALTAPRAAQLADAARRAGFLVNAVQPDAVRLAPPLVIDAGQVREFLDALPAVLAETEVAP
jgi:acetylornithine aminotransferase